MAPQGAIVVDVAGTSLTTKVKVIVIVIWSTRELGIIVGQSLIVCIEFSEFSCQFVQKNGVELELVSTNPGTMG
ncbi:hypothetical protein Hdeb2414_s0001g00042131 [Helianthus debilis subsp. tardiflorus]